VRRSSNAAGNLQLATGDWQLATGNNICYHYLLAAPENGGKCQEKTVENSRGPKKTRQVQKNCDKVTIY